jgi:hypothetical protein
LERVSHECFYCLNPLNTSLFWTSQY